MMRLPISGFISHALATVVSEAPHTTYNGFSGVAFIASSTKKRAPGESCGVSGSVIAVGEPA